MIETIEELRRLYPPPGKRAVRKELPHLDGHCRRFIELSPFVVLASGDGARLDASPRGGEPGFVRVRDAHTLWLPDSPGNNRLDTLENIIRSRSVGMLFLIPGVDETLRVNGAARVLTDADTVGRFATERRTPKVVVEVAVQEAYLHCAKALMRSRLWEDESRRDRGVLPPMGKMINDQTGDDRRPESREEMIARYSRDL